MLIQNFLNKTKYDIKQDDNLFFVRKNNKVTLPDSVSTDLAYLIGLIQGDGHLKTNERRVGITIKEANMIESVCKILRNYFEYNPTIYKKIDKKMLWEVVINSLIIFEFLRINFDLVVGKKKGKQECPINLRNNEDFFLAWLAGFIDSDGHITKCNSLEIVQSTKKILEDIANDLKKFYNVESRLSYNPANDGYYLYVKKKAFAVFSKKLRLYMLNTNKINKMG